MVANSGKKFSIRPAFYLNEDAVVVKSGVGTETEPYAIDSTVAYSEVLLNGVTMQFDQQPVLENDRILVPMRAVFEGLGAVNAKKNVGKRERVNKSRDYFKDCVNLQTGI